MFKKLLKNKVFIVTFIFVAVVSVFVYVNIPKDIGSKLHYIGRHEGNCLPFPLFFLCLGSDGAELYYATELSEEDLKRYFTKARLSPETSELNVSGSGYSYDSLDFKIDNDSFRLKRYYKKQDIINAYNLKEVNLPYIISINSHSYDLVKSSL